MCQLKCYCSAQLTQRINSTHVIEQMSYTTGSKPRLIKGIFSSADLFYFDWNILNYKTKHLVWYLSCFKILRIQKSVFEYCQYRLKATLMTNAITNSPRFLESAKFRFRLCVKYLFLCFTSTYEKTLSSEKDTKKHIFKLARGKLFSNPIGLSVTVCFPQSHILLQMIVWALHLKRIFTRHKCFKFFNRPH